MAKTIFYIAAAAAGVAVLAAVWSVATTNERLRGERWYSTAQVAAGEKVFVQNCMSCHGVAGVGEANWRVRTSTGAYPPPPLNGTAHTWHHSLSDLRRTIEQGGIAWGGEMPGFQNKLTAEQRDAVIAYFQSQWPDKIYQAWQQKQDS